MRARHRHLKPSSLAATIAYDSRYINESDGTTIQTWGDRSGNSRDLSQSDSTKRPTFKTGIQGGCGVMRFDGSNDSMSTSSYTVTNVVSGLCVMKNTQTSANCIFERSTNFNNNNHAYMSFVENGTTLSFSHKTTGSPVYVAANFTTRSTNFCIVTYRYGGADASYEVYSNGSLLNKAYIANPNTLNGHATGTLNAATFVGARNNAQFFYNGDMGALMTIPEDVSAALRKRINHHAAFSFKIACN
jgi:hypothetical protein